MQTALEDLAKETEQHQLAVRSQQAVEESALGALEQTAARLPHGIQQIHEGLEKLL
jgi:hypothetical protein